MATVSFLIMGQLEQPSPDSPRIVAVYMFESAEESAAGVWSKKSLNSIEPLSRLAQHETI